MRPVCVECKREMSVEKNEVSVRYKVGDDEVVEVYSGDLFKCDVCEKQIVTGFGEGMPILSGPSRDNALVFTRNGDYPCLDPKPQLIDDGIPIDSIKNIVAYNFERESDDYHFMKDQGEDVDAHIFEDIKRIDEWAEQDDLNPSAALLHEKENDYVLKEEHSSVWVEVGDLVVYIHRRQDGVPVGGVVVDVFRDGEAADDPIDTIIVTEEA